MAKFYPLNVKEVRRETRDSVVITLDPPTDAPQNFEFIQGQYLTFRHMTGNEELRRCYSICSGVGDGTLRVGIKQVEGGCFSSYANNELKVGDTLEAMKPMGRFHAPLSPDEARSYLGFAGGSGITPLISIIKTVLDREPASTFSLVYGNRSASSIMFREELEDLKNSHLDRLNIIHILEAETEIDLFSGLLTEEKCAKLFELWIDPKEIDLAFLCGPEPMMDAASKSLQAAGLPKAIIKLERFAAAAPVQRPAASPAETKSAGPAVCKTRIVIDGVSRDLDIVKNEKSVLEAALAENLDAPFACKAGICSTCRAKVIEGEAEMKSNAALEDYEVENGYVLTCQCYPISDTLVIDYDQ